MIQYVYETQAYRVIMERGGLQRIDQEVARLRGNRVLLIGTPSKSDDASRIADLLGARIVGRFEEEAPHVPIEAVQKVRALAATAEVDCIVALGGGSTIGLAKAVAVHRRAPIVALPTTYSGSEVTPVYGITENGVKRGTKDPECLPKVAIYDPDLVISMPPMLSLTSGMNAMSHSVEALYAKDANPIASLMAEESIRALARSLPSIMRWPEDVDARLMSLRGAWLAGMSLASVGMSLHHKLCHTLGGSFGLPHAETHAVVLPHAIAYNLTAAPSAMERLAHALDVDSHPDATLWSFVHRLGGPTSLKEIGMSASDLDRAADLAMETPYYSPRPVERAAIRQLMQDAFDGRQPGS